jgi:hypothetical protein
VFGSRSEAACVSSAVVAASAGSIRFTRTRLVVGWKSLLSAGTGGREPTFDPDSFVHLSATAQRRKLHSMCVSALPWRTESIRRRRLISNRAVQEQHQHQPHRLERCSNDATKTAATNTTTTTTNTTTTPVGVATVQPTTETRRMEGTRAPHIGANTTSTSTPSPPYYCPRARVPVSVPAGPSTPRDK